MIHIVFHEADIAALKKSFELDNSLTGDIVQIKDDYAVGPLAGIYTEEGILARKEWWRGVLQGGDYEGLVDSGKIDDNKTAAGLVSRLNDSPDETVWIWVAQNKHDVSGYYWLVSQLADFQGRIFILYLNNLPFLNEKGHVFYPVNLFNIPPREFLKARKLARPLTRSEFEMDADEWTKICLENRGVRLLEGGKKLVQADYDFYDSSLLNMTGNEWIRAGKLMHLFLARAVHTTGDAYLLWRLKKLIADGKIDAQGDLRNMKDFEVKAKLSQPVAS